MPALKRAQLTIRGVEGRLARALRAEARRHGESVNSTVLRLLAEGLRLTPAGEGAGATRTNGLDRFAGSWAREEAEAFDSALAAQRRIDPEMWK